MLLLRPYLEGSQLTICTDQVAHKLILDLADATGVFANWQIRLFEHELDIVHSAGIKHQEADALSKLKSTGTDQMRIDEEITVLSITTSIRLENVEARVICMQCYGEIDDSKGTKTAAVHYIAIKAITNMTNAR